MLNKIAQKLISVATFAVLARILEPSTFGLFAMAFILIDGFQLLKSFGLDTALIQRKDNIEEASHTAYIIVQVQGFILFAICFLAAPLAGHFFHNPDVTSIVRALGIIFIFTSFSKIPTTLLTKAMKFNTLALIELTGAVVNSIVAIVIALFNPTVWALVWAYLARQLVMAVMARRLSGYRVKWQFDKKIAWELLHYGKFIIGLGILYYIRENISNLVVGKMLGASMLGYFALAFSIGNFINTHFTQLVSGVMFPAYASVQHDREELKRVFLKTIKFVSLVSLPFAVFLLTLSKELVMIVYGEKWLQVVDLLRIYGVIQIIVPIAACAGALFLGSGNPKYSYQLAVTGLLIKVPVLFFFIQWWGILGAVLSELAVFIVTVPYNLHLTRRITGIQWIEYFGQLSISIQCAVVGLVVAYLVRLALGPILGLTPLLNAVIMGTSILVLAGGTYIGLLYVKDRAMFQEIKTLILRRSQKAAA